MKKVFDQTVRDIKRGVNKKVLKVPSIEQKVLDATSNESWGPHGTHLADIAQASRNYHEYQMIMSVVWKRLNDTGKNWRHVFKALTVLEYLVANGSERVIEDIREHAYQISTLSTFQYIDSTGRDQGSNVRKKSQSLVALVNDKEKIQEAREKAAASRDKFRNASEGPGVDQYEGRYGSRDEDRNGYGREREWGDDKYGHDGGRYGEDQYGRDGYKDDEYRGRSRSVDGDYGPRSRSSDRDRERAFEDDGHHSSRGSNARVEDGSQDRSQPEPKFSGQNLEEPPSYEDAVGQHHSSVDSKRDGETTFAPEVSSPQVNTARQETLVSNKSAAQAADTPPPPAAATPAPAVTSNTDSEGFDLFDPRGSFPVALPPPSGGAEIDLLGSLSDSFSSKALALVPTTSATTEAHPPNSNPYLTFMAAPSATTEAHPPTNSNPYLTDMAAPPPAGVSSQPFDDPFGDGPFRAVPSTDGFSAQPPTSAFTTSAEPPLSVAPTSNVGFGDAFDQTIDILADILPPPGPSQTAFQAQPSQLSTETVFPSQTGQPSPPTGFPAQPNQTTFPSSFPGPFGQPTSQPTFPSQGGQPMPQHGFQPQSDQSVSELGGQSMPPAFQPQGGQSVPQSTLPPQGGQSMPKPAFPPQGGQSVPQPAFLPQSGQSVPQPAFLPQSGQSVSQSALPPQGGQSMPQPAFPPQGGRSVPQPAFPVQGVQSVLQPGFPHQGGQSVQQPGFPPQGGQSTPQPAFPVQGGHQLSFPAQGGHQLSFPAQGGQYVSQPGLTAQGRQSLLQPSFAPQGQNASLGGFSSQLGTASQAGFPSSNGQPAQPNNFYGGLQPQGSSAPVPSLSQVTPTPAPQYNVSNFYQQQQPQLLSSSLPASSQPAPSASTGALAIVPQQPAKDKFETKSTVWADTLNRGLVNLNISGSKTNPLSDIGIDFDAINRKEKRMEKPSKTPVTSNVAMGKAMGSGSGIGRAGAGALRPAANPVVGPGMGITMGAPGPGPGFGAGYGGVNQHMGMNNMPPQNMGIGMNIGQGFHMQRPPAGFPPGAAMPGNYNPMFGRGAGYGQQPYGGYR